MSSRVSRPRPRFLLARAMALITCVTLLASSGGYKAVASSARAAAPLIVNLAQAPASLDPAETCGFTDLTVLDNL